MDPSDITAVQSRATALGVPDGLVFRRITRTSWAHLGGLGRGEGWAGVVEVDALLDPAGSRIPTETGDVTVFGFERSAQLIGPYYCVTGALVRVSPDILVVLGNQGGSFAPGITPAGLLELATLLTQSVTEAGPAKRLADELEVLHAVRTVISQPAMHAIEALEHVLTIALEALSCDAGVVRDGRGRWARSEALAGADISSFQLKETLDHLAELAGEGLICFQDVSALDTNLAPLGYDDGVRSLLVVRIPDPVGGVLVVAHTVARPRGFTTLCQELGRNIAEAAVVVAHTAALREELSAAADQHAMQARIDPLTGIGNRLAWDEALASAQRHVDAGGFTTVLTLDVDGLKAVNDTYGHAAGDELLRRCATILKESVRSGDICARLGGDEFAVLLPHPEELAEARIVALRRQLSTAAISSATNATAASIGMATAHPYSSVADAVREADLAMYAVKRGRRDVIEEQLPSTVVERPIVPALVSGLRGAQRRPTVPRPRTRG
jgi:diguanylate cyclase (GGDEF)-like protein